MRIHQLAPDVAAKIAAGEVVERPANVAKELLENSLDAGADEISVEIKEGGQRLLRIIDNGHGILPEDVPLVFQRHATSKLDTAEDLNHIATFGFRGEALYSISAVSQSKRTRSPRSAALTIAASSASSWLTRGQHGGATAKASGQTWAIASTTTR